MNDFVDKILALESFIVAFITLISTFGGLWLQKKWKRTQDHSECALAASARKNAEILKVLKKLKNEFSADRSYVFEFHNGNYFSSGSPMQKFTCTYEVVADGVSSECHNPGEYRMSNYNEYISSIIHERDYCVEDVSLMTSDALLRSLLTNKGVKSLYNIPIRTFEGNTVGFLGLDFVKSTRVLSDCELNSLRSAAKIITGYIAS